jgi:hypothetical protein
MPPTDWSAVAKRHVIFSALLLALGGGAESQLPEERKGVGYATKVPLRISVLDCSAVERPNRDSPRSFQAWFDLSAISKDY